MILVTGARGTLGRRLVQALRTQTPRITPVVGVGLEHSGDVGYVRCDLGEYRQVEQLAERFHLGPNDYVYHLGAEFGRMNGEDYYEQCWRTNVIGTKHLIRIQERHWFKMIFASSSEVYGELPPGEVYDEEATQRCPLVHYNDYAMTKWVNEQQIRNSMTTKATETMILRFFNAYGPGEDYHPYRSVVSLFIHAALTLKRFQVFQGYHRAFMYVDDLINTVSQSWRHFKAGGVYNIGGREYCSVEDLALCVLKETGAPASLMNVITEGEHNVTSKRPVITRAERDLDHDPQVTLEHGIPWTVDWMRQQGVGR